MLGEDRRVVVGAECDDVVVGWVEALFAECVEMGDGVEGLCADGAGGAEDGDAEAGRGFGVGVGGHWWMVGGEGRGALWIFSVRPEGIKMKKER